MKRNGATEFFETFEPSSSFCSWCILRVI